jgi:hypothetical protein
MRIHRHRDTDRTAWLGGGSESSNPGPGILKKLSFNLGRALMGTVMRCLWTVAFVMALATSAQAFKYEQGGFGLDVDTTLSYGVSMRAAEKDDQLLYNSYSPAIGSKSKIGVFGINGDDGNRNFNKGDLVTNRLSATMDIDANYKKKFGVFVRPRYFYDLAYDNPNANRSADTNNNMNTYGGPLTATDHFTRETQKAHRDKFEVLDAFVYGSHNFSGHDVSVRIGRQVVSWGESLFLQNGIASGQSPLDATQAYAPGVELRDIFLPTGQVQASVGLGAGFSATGYYQWEWAKTRLSGTGSFYSTTDFLGDGGERYLIPLVVPTYVATVDRTEDRDARNSGQWGAGLRYRSDKLNATEFGAYYMNYHSKIPTIRSTFGTGGNQSPSMKGLGGDWTNLFNLLYGPGPVASYYGGVFNNYDLGSYWMEYPEDIKLYGFSAGTTIGGANLGLDLTYRKDVPLGYVDPTVPLFISYGKGYYYQAQLSILDLFPATKVYDQLTFAAEIGMGFADDMGRPEKDLYYNKFSWGFVSQLSFDWFNVLPGIDLNVPLTYTCNPDGTSPLATFQEKNDSFSAALGITYLKNLKTTLGYVVYLNRPDYNPTADRDYVYLNLKYTF